IPRGGRSLIQNVVQNASVPVIETGEGICHTYIDDQANPELAANIAINAKVQRPSVCNSMETLLVHQADAARELSSLADKLRDLQVELRGCPATRELLPWSIEASEEDWNTEYNDL